MPDLLLEIYSEEVPFSCQIDAENIFEASFNKHLNEEKIPFKKINTFSTSRRITVYIEGIASRSSSEIKEIKGPAIDSKKIAVDGFLNSQKVDKINELTKKKIKDKEYYFYMKKIDSKRNDEELKKQIINILKSFKWKKSMRWAEHSDKWIRPIKEILCVFNKKVLTFKFAGKTSSNVTYGNYIFSDSKLVCNTFEEYKLKLNKHFVELKRSERERKILSKINQICKKYNLKSNFDFKMLSEATNLCEKPYLFLGSFDSSFFSMPDSFLVAVMSDELKYFSFRNENGSLSEKFGFVSNHQEDILNNIRKGHERVLRAKFKDSIFFINEDKKIKMNERLKLLDEITYFEDLGSMFDKSKRIALTADLIGKKINFKFSKKHYQVALLCKADLSSEMVKEFPSLQGNVGAYYLTLEGIEKSLANGIKNQYQPKSQNDLVPNESFTICLALADKIDNILGLFLTGKKPSGSKDPFGVRRSALGIIRILVENKILLNLNEIFKSNLDKFKIISKFEIQEVIDFIHTRLVIFYKENSLKLDVIKALTNYKRLDPYDIYLKSTILQKSLTSVKGKHFISSFKRLDSILPDKYDYQNLKIQQKVFETFEEKKLYDETLNFDSNFNEQNKTYDFNLYLESIFNLSHVINNFFDEVKVNTANEQIKKNRLNLLRHCKKIICKKINFSFLE